MLRPPDPGFQPLLAIRVLADAVKLLISICCFSLSDQPIEPVFSVSLAELKMCLLFLSNCKSVGPGLRITSIEWMRHFYTFLNEHLIIDYIYIHIYGLSSLHCVIAGLKWTEKMVCEMGHDVLNQMSLLPRDRTSRRKYPSDSGCIINRLEVREIAPASDTISKKSDK